MNKDTVTKLLSINRNFLDISNQIHSISQEFLDEWETLNKDLKHYLENERVGLEPDTSDLLDSVDDFLITLSEVTDAVKWQLTEKTMTYDDFRSLAQPNICNSEKTIYIVESYCVPNFFTKTPTRDLIMTSQVITETFNSAKNILREKMYTAHTYRALIFYRIRERILGEDKDVSIWLFDRNMKEISATTIENNSDKDNRTVFRGYDGPVIKPGDLAVELDLLNSKIDRCIVTKSPYTTKQCWDKRQEIIEHCRENDILFTLDVYNKAISNESLYGVHCMNEQNEYCTISKIIPINGNFPELQDWYKNYIASKSQES